MVKPSTSPAAPQSRRAVALLLAVAILASLTVLVVLLVQKDRGADAPAAVSAAPPEDAFYMPAEFDPQEALFLGGDQLADLHPEVMAAIVKAAAADIRILILAGSRSGRSLIETTLNDRDVARSAYDIVQLPVLTMWVRDFGPVTVSDAQGRRSLVDFHYRERRGNTRDDMVPDYLAVQLDLNLLGSPLLVEGGDFLSNGRGFCLVSTRVVNRNAHYLEKEPRATVETLAAVLGFENLFLVPPLQGESTGHVDMFCTFLQPDLALVGSYTGGVDEANAAQLDDIVGDLAGVATLTGPMRIERIPMPDHDDGVWRTYTNVIFANGVLLVPIYPDYCPDLDRQALAIYRRLLPDRRVVGIDASGLIRMNGALRCITMNLPSGQPLAPPAGP
jgi:agmatine/peptidylarginine deiminase